MVPERGRGAPVSVGTRILLGDRLPEVLTLQGWDEAMELAFLISFQAILMLLSEVGRRWGGRGEGNTRKTPGTKLTILADGSKCLLAGPRTSFHSRALNSGPEGLVCPELSLACTAQYF